MTALNKPSGRVRTRSGTLKNGGVAAGAAAAMLLSSVNPPLADASSLRTYVATANLDGRTAMDLDNHAYPDLFREGSELRVLCQASGPVAYRSPIWDIVATGTDTAAAGRPVVVPDRYIRTGYSDFSPELPRCNESDLRKVATNEAELHAAAELTRTFNETDQWWASLSEAQQSQQQWKAVRAATLERVARIEALRVAGINETEWNPEDGLTAQTEAIVPKVYQYYAHLFNQRPELLWTGLASLAGGPVYAGIQDTAHTVDLFNAKFVERQLLTMQKAIFWDLAWQHELYLQRGIEGLRAVQAGEPRALGDAGSRNAPLVDFQSTELITAWEDIATGDAGRVNRGNRVLIAREQDPVLQQYYDDLVRDARTITIATSTVARSPVTGKDDWFRDIEPDGKCWPPYSLSRQPKTHRDEEGCRPPNVGWWEDRQIWIYQYVFPRFARMAAEDPAWVHAQIARPVQDRAAEFRTLSRANLQDGLSFGVF